MADPQVLPNMTATDLISAAWARYTEWYIMDTRVNRIGNQDIITWKQQRTRDNDRLYRGDWTVLYPDETSKVHLPKVQNLYQVACDDLARLVSATSPDIFSPPMSDSTSDITAARLREMVMKTHWKRGGGDDLRAWMSLDLSITGTAFLAAVHPSKKTAYPVPYRLDPRGCFPDVVNGQLQDLIVMQRIRARQAEALLNIDLSNNDYFGKISPGSYNDVEIVDYYHPMGVIRVVTAVANNEPIGVPFLYSKVRYDLERVPVGFAMLPSGDGQFRGHFDQLSNVLATSDTVTTLLIDYADQGVYAPFEEYGVSNNTETPGPKTVYHHIDEKSYMRRVQPAISSPQLFQLLEYSESQARAGAARPSSREGEVNQSIASGSFVNSTQGALTTMVQDDQRLLATLQAQWHTAALHLDEQFGNAEKPLWRPVGKQFTYKPKKDINGIYDCEVVYGAGAGLDYLNRKAAIFQEVGAGLISKDTARGQMDDIPDAEAERVKIEREQVMDAYLQKIVNQDDPTALQELIKAMAKGQSLFEASTAAIKAQQEALAAQQAQMQQGQETGGAAAPAAPGGPPPPATPGAQGPAQPAVPPFVPSQPLTNIQKGR